MRIPTAHPVHHLLQPAVQQVRQGGLRAPPLPPARDGVLGGQDDACGCVHDFILSRTVILRHRAASALRVIESSEARTTHAVVCMRQFYILDFSVILLDFSAMESSEARTTPEIAHDFRTDVHD